MDDLGVPPFQETTICYTRVTGYRVGYPWGYFYVGPLFVCWYSYSDAWFWWKSRIICPKPENLRFVVRTSEISSADNKSIQAIQVWPVPCRKYDRRAVQFPAAALCLSAASALHAVGRRGEHGVSVAGALVVQGRIDAYDAKGVATAFPLASTISFGWNIIVWYRFNTAASLVWMGRDILRI